MLRMYIAHHMNDASVNVASLEQGVAEWQVCRARTCDENILEAIAMDQAHVSSTG